MPGSLGAIGIGTFGGASAFPLLVAREAGLLGDLVVDHVRTSASRDLREGLASGRLAIVHAAPDNVVAWRDGGLDVQAWLAGSNGPITLLAASARATADLRGRRVAVDAASSGFVPILRRLLAEAGLSADDVELVALGATRLRYEALRSGDIEATMLTPPWSILAQRDGAVVLGTHDQVSPSLLTSCALSRASWLDGHVAECGIYARALDGALAWLRDRRHRERALELLAADLDIATDVAEQLLDLMDGPGGWPASTVLSGTELSATWDLRAETMGPPASPPTAYVRPTRSLVGDGA